MSEQEGRQILQDLGFHCLTLDPNQREYEIVHFLNSFNGPLSLSYSETSFDGKSLTPSRIWLLEHSKTNSQNQKQPSGPHNMEHLSTTAFKRHFKKIFFIFYREHTPPSSRNKMALRSENSC